MASPPPRSSEPEAKVGRPDDRKRMRASRRRKGRSPLPPTQAVCPPLKPRSPSDLDVEDEDDGDIIDQLKLHCAIAAVQFTDKHPQIWINYFIAINLHPVVARVEASRKKANHGLRTFQLKPSDLSGTALLDHMIRFRRREYESREEEHAISKGLDVKIRTKHQEQIMGKVGEGTSLDKAAKVRLDNLGLIANQSAFVNNPVRLRRLESQLRLQPTSPYHTPSGPSPKPQPNQAHPLPPYPINIPSGYTRAMTMHGRDKDSDVEKVPQTLLLAEAVLKGVQDIKARGYQDWSSYLNYF